MKQLIRLIILGVGVMIMVQSCYYDKAYELVPGVETCDTTNYAFSADVKPIMDNYCVSCHNVNLPSANIAVDTYEGVKQIADNGSLLGSIRHEDYSPMPKNLPKLDPCTIKTVELWVNDGALDN